jgi:DNA-binding SARP family transcriptional activator
MAADDAPFFRLLGHLEVGAGRGPEGLGGPKQRGMLAYLLLHHDQVVSTERLVDAVWGDEPPPTAAAIVHAYVRRLRQTLEETPARLTSTSSGYRLELQDGALDVALFEQLAERGRTELRNGDAHGARDTLAEALSLWRGAVLGGVDGEGFVRVEQSRLDAVWLSTKLARIDADLRLGRAGEVVSELESLSREHPLDEGIRGQLMLALYRSGNQADALTAYHDLRRALAQELGLEPSRTIQELETSILGHDPSLDVPSVRTGRPEPAIVGIRPESSGGLRVSRPAAAAAVAVLIVAVAAAGLRSGVLGRPSPSNVPAAVNGTNPPQQPARILGTWAIPQPSCCGSASDAEWGVGHHDDVLREIDPKTNVLTSLGIVADYQSGVPEALAGSIWIPSARDSLIRYDPDSHQVVARIAVSGSDVAFGFLDIWETTGDHRLVRIDLASNAVIASIPVATGESNWVDGLAIGGDFVWDSVGDTSQLLKIDPATNQVIDRITGFGDTDSGAPIAFDHGSVWLLRSVAGQMTLFRIDATTDRVVATIPVGSVGGNTGTVAAGGGYIWTATWDGSLSRVDPATNRVSDVLTLPDAPQNIAFANGSLWVDAYDAGQVWRIAPPGS